MGGIVRALGWIWTAIIVALSLNVATAFIIPLAQKNLRLFLQWAVPSFTGLVVVSLALWLWHRLREKRRRAQEKLRAEEEERRQQQEARRQEEEAKWQALERLFPPLKPAREVDPARDLAIREFHEAYEPRPFNEKALAWLYQSKGVLLLGRPKAGKTRAAWQTLHDHFPDHLVMSPVVQLLHPSDIDFSPLKSKRVVLLLDDLDRYAYSTDMTSLVAALKAQAAECLLMTTCRGGDKEEALIVEKMGAFYGQLEKLPLEDMGLTQAERLANTTDNAERLSQFDGTPGSILLDLEDMRRRYSGYTEVQRAPLKAFKLLYAAGILDVTLDRLRCVLHHLFQMEFSAPGSLDTLLKRLVDGGFLVIRGHDLDVYRVYLEDIVEDYLQPEQDFLRLRAALEACQDAIGLMILGSAFMAREDFVLAEVSLQQSLGMMEQSSLAHFGYALTLWRLDRLEQAEQHFRRALELDEEFPETHLVYASILYASKRQQEAEIHFRRSLELRDESAEAHFRFAGLLRATGRLKEAESHLRRALELPEELPEAHYRLASLLTDTGNVQEAERHFLRALELQENNAIGHNDYAYMLYRLERKEEAEKHFLRALELQENNAVTHNNYAHVLDDMGRTQEAERHYRRALEIDPNAGPSLQGLTVILLKTNREKEARGLLKRLYEHRDVLDMEVKALLRTYLGEIALGEVDP